MEPTSIVLATIAGLGALGMAVTAAVILAQVAEDRDIRARLVATTEPRSVGMRVLPRGLLRMVVSPFQRLGESLRHTALFQDKELQRFERAVSGLGLDGPGAVQAFVGAKLVSFFVLPALGYLGAGWLGYGPLYQIGALIGGFVLVVFGASSLLSLIYKPYERQLRKGLPDALDLLVVCAEAGLGLDTAIERVSRELSRSNRPMANELALLARELRMLPDRREALDRFAARSSIDSFKQVAATLSQTLRYGTPLGQALRTLAADQRSQRLLALEERAVRLPALLTMPMIFFILPSLFIALAAPSFVGMVEMLQRR